MRRRFVLAVALFVPLSAVAGPPFVTDDPEPVDVHHWEIYTASQHVKTAEGWSGATPSFDVNYGLVRNVHVHALLQGGYVAPAAGAAHYGYGDTEVGAKIRFVDETDRRPQMAIYPAIEVPTGNDRLGLGAGHTQAFLPLWIQKSWGPWATYGGVGYWINPGAGNRNWIYLGWTVQRKMTDRLMMGGEAFHRTPDSDGGASSDGYNLGAGYDLSARYHLLFSAGRDWRGSNRFTSYLALQWTYPGDLRAVKP